MILRDATFSPRTPLSHPGGTITKKDVQYTTSSSTQGPRQVSQHYPPGRPCALLVQPGVTIARYNWDAEPYVGPGQFVCVISDFACYSPGPQFKPLSLVTRRDRGISRRLIFPAARLPAYSALENWASGIHCSRKPKGLRQKRRPGPPGSDPLSVLRTWP